MRPLAAALLFGLVTWSSLAIAQDGEKAAQPNADAPKSDRHGESEKPELRTTSEPRKVRVILPSPYDGKRP